VQAAVALHVGALIGMAEDRRVEAGGPAAMVGVRVAQDHPLDASARCR
jgi:hypothetical protein